MLVVDVEGVDKFDRVLLRCLALSWSCLCMVYVESRL